MAYSRLKCPQCRTQLLEETQHGDEEIALCRNCAGLWLKNSAANRLIEEVNDGPAGAHYQQRFGNYLGESQRQCPECEQNMKHFHLLENYHTEIDICEGCDGSWLDKNELEEVQQSSMLQLTLEGLNKKINWKTYLFQLLTQMPVEYNIQPRKRPWVNYSLILLNCLIFIAYFYVRPDSMRWVLETFAQTPAYTMHGEKLWTLLSCVFLHGSLMHLVGNMYFLYIIGDNLESVLGSKRYLLLYLFCGIAASFFSMLFYPDSMAPSVGASGAIAALFGMYLIWFRYASITFMFILYQKKLSAYWFFAIWLGLNLYGAFYAADNVDYGAHLGGFFVGLLIGYWMKERVFNENPIIRLLNQNKVQLSR